MTTETYVSHWPTAEPPVLTMGRIVKNMLNALIDSSLSTGVSSCI